MTRFTRALCILTGLACQGVSCQNLSGTAHAFDEIAPSANITWQPCFDDFTCARLEVPLDYANRSIGTTPIAFIKLTGKNATAESPSIVVIPGGPGGSGVNLLLEYRDLAGQAFGEQYNFVSFDPRGVNNSGPNLDCFSGNAEARLAFDRLHNTGVTNISSTSPQEQYYSSSIYGEWCNRAVETEFSHAYYVTTPAVAQDLLTFTEAEAEQAGQSPSDAQLWAYGSSYGTVIGATFASMFPDRVGRLVLDGVMNAEQYYDNDWRDSIDQADEAMESFASSCHSAGPEACSFWGPTPTNITARLDAITQRLLSHPVPLSGSLSGDLPTMVTYSDLKALFIPSLSTPLSSFPALADVLQQLERDNVTALAGTFERLMGGATDAGRVIRCADSYRRNKLTTIEEWGSYVEHMASRSKYLGDIFPLYVETILCRSVQPQLPDSLMVPGPITGLGKNISFPILFTSNTIDPVTPLKSAKEMSSRFPGSVLLQQEAVGHTVILQMGSICYFQHVQAYFQGAVPPSNITCPQQYAPFLGSLS